MTEQLAGATEWNLDDVLASPQQPGLLRLICRRPAIDEREVLDVAELDLATGLQGDNWLQRGSSSTPDGSANPQCQLTVMNARAAQMFAGAQDNWSQAGDQLFVDMDISVTNLPPGTRLAIGSAVIAVSEKAHTGCHKFSARFGADALRLVSSPRGSALRLRGLNARVVQPGEIRVGDEVRKLA